jgi:hypothetical protein
MTARGRASLRALVLLMGLALLPGTAQAQDYDTSVAWGGGAIQFTPFVEAGSASPGDIGLGTTWVAVVHAETWRFNRWVGLRAGGFYSHAPVSYPTASKNTSVYGLEAAALLRVAPPVPNRFLTAYLIGGGGVVWFGMGAGPTVPLAGTTVIYDDSEARQFLALGGAGIEILPGWRAFDGQLGVRIEGVDQMVLGRPLRADDAGSTDPMHNLRLSLTLFSGVPRLF